VTTSKFRRDLWPIVCHCLRDPTFSPFSTVRACDRQTHDDSIYCASVASQGKNSSSFLMLYKSKL